MGLQRREGLNKKLSQTITTLSVSCVLFLAGCESLVKHDQTAPEVDDLLIRSDRPISPEKISVGNVPLDAPNNQERDKTAEYYSGNGVFIGQPYRDSGQESSGEGEKGDVTLNFQDTDIHEVVKVILGDLLKKNYVIDPAVAGTVNIQTSNPLKRSDLIPTLENLLLMSNASLVERNGLIKIIPATNAALESLPPSVGRRVSSGTPGYQTQIVPLRYVSAQQILKILQPFLKTTAAQVDPGRNIIILTGSQSNIRRLTETVRIFDVDWLKGMSLAIVPLNYAESKDVVKELVDLFGLRSKSPLEGVIRFVSLERLNSVIVISQQPRYLQEMTRWIERLDRSDGVSGQKLFVYQVQNTRAEELAEVLNKIFSDGNSSSSGQVPDAELAPGLEPVTMQSEDNIGGVEEGSEEATPVQQITSSSGDGDGVSIPGKNAVKIIADDANNSLVILASPTDYLMVENALRKLDITPLQVLIEASIIEVTLTDNLRYGLEWFFKTESGIGNKNGQVRLDQGTAIAGPDGVGPISPGFSYGIVDAAGAIRAVLNALAEESRVNVLSSPSLMVLDNRTATINVGDSVPILNSTSTGTLVPNAPVVNQIEYRDTGVLMTVTPRVNAGGLITLEVKQEVTDVTNPDAPRGPTFQQRSIESTISVQSGNTIVLGGLIRDNRSDNNSGIPVLHKAPIIGPLFGQSSDNLTRTELVVLLTPRAIQNEEDSWRITNEFKEKLRDVEHSLKRDPDYFLHDE